MKVGVILASLGRPDDLAHVGDHLARQTQPPEVVILSLERPEDAPSPVPQGVEILYGPRGLCAQRNRGIEAALGRCDVVVFFDDDYVPSKRAIAAISDLFEGHLDVAGATGKVLADGVASGGVPYETARAIVEAYDETEAPATPWIRDVATAYGCNMAFRMSAVTDLRFDERLPLYGWQEDVDFAGRLRLKGRMVATDAFAGVHCGVTRGRMPGKRLGFSQMVNPVYLVRKGSMRPAHALTLMTKNFLANHAKMFAPEAHIDRRGRAVGNWLGLGAILKGRSDPMSVLELDAGRAPTSPGAKSL